MTQLKINWENFGLGIFFNHNKKRNHQHLRLDRMVIAYFIIKFLIKAQTRYSKGHHESMIYSRVLPVIIIILKSEMIQF